MNILQVAATSCGRRYVQDNECGPEEIRTLDLRYAKATLYQLSYRPETSVQKNKKYYELIL